MPPGVKLEQNDGILTVVREDDSKAAVHGLVRALVNSSVEGVTKGWTKELDIVGIGYRAEMKGKGTVVFTWDIPSHRVSAARGHRSSDRSQQTHLTVSGIDRQKVGFVAAEMRSLRPPDPYKNKGVRYTNERLKKKVGKTGAK